MACLEFEVFDTVAVEVLVPLVLQVFDTSAAAALGASFVQEVFDTVAAVLGASTRPSPHCPPQSTTSS